MTSKYSFPDYDIKGDSKVKKQTKVIYHFSNTYGGYDVDILIRDTGSSQYLYEVKFKKKSSQQSMEDKTSSPAAKADVGNQKDSTTSPSQSQGENSESRKLTPTEQLRASNVK